MCWPGLLSAWRSMRCTSFLSRILLVDGRHRLRRIILTGHHFGGAGAPPGHHPLSPLCPLQTHQPMRRGGDRGGGAAPGGGGAHGCGVCNTALLSQFDNQNAPRSPIGVLYCCSEQHFYRICLIDHLPGAWPSRSLKSFMRRSFHTLRLRKSQRPLLLR